jgi:flagellar hook-basal body protein
MTLFGALSSGVSGLTAQSSAMGAISDNITNVSTVGYKNTQVDFQTLVTTQTSTTFYSAGGVQSKPRQDTGVQGLLAASTSQTDVAISGSGFFVVNEANTPSINNEFLFTRAGSFFQDNEGFLRNTAGFYLQGWPTTAGGAVTPNNETLTIPNQNVISTDYLATVNLNRVGGTATSTSNIGIGANLPSNDSAATTHKTDVQFFDSLGNANTMSVIYEKSTADNEWKMRIDPPPGTTHLTMENSTLNPKVYRSVGQLEFNKKNSTGASLRPADGASMTMNSGGVTRTYVFDNNSSVTNATAQQSTVTIANVGNVAQISTFTLAQVAAVAQIDTIQATRGTAANPADVGDTFSVTINGTTATYTATALDTTDESIALGLKGVIDADGTLNPLTTVATNGTGLLTITAATAGTALDYTTTPPAVTHQGGGTADGAMGAATNTTANVNVPDIDVAETVTATINGTAITYTYAAAETITSAATNLASAINASSEGSNVTASSALGVVTLTANTAGTPFTLASSDVDADSDMTLTTATTTANVTVDVDDGETLSATIGGIAITYTYASDNVTTAAAKFAAQINATTTTTTDLTTGNLPVNQRVTASSSGGVLTITSNTPGTAFSFAAAEGGVDADADMTVTAATPTANAGTANTYKVDTSASTTLAGDVAALLAAIRTNDPNYDSTNNRVKTSPASSTTLLFEDDGLNSITIDPTGLKDSTGQAVAAQETSFTISKRDTLYTDYTQLKFSTVPSNGETIVINNITYTFTTNEAADTGGVNTTIFRDGPLDQVLADLEAAIETNDPNFSGDSIKLRASDGPSNNTLVLSSLTNGNTYTVNVAGLANKPTEPDGTNTVGSSIYTATNIITVGTDPAISFTTGGVPNAINIAELEIKNFSNGAANMDDDPSNSSQITMDFGTLNESNGMTQFGAEFTPGFITQNGSQFGTFAGVTINTSGLVTALFDNGETRPVFQLPIATFVNVNSLGNRTGNVWNATEASGDPTLRTADNGSAGQVVQASLEQSTVDIGEEFTKMIVVQRAFSASAKIISTADEMLEELLRTKR